MYKGVYEGSHTSSLKKKILILGESHYSKDENNDFTTESVINNYKKYFCNSKEYQKYQFFHKIAQSFNIDKDNTADEFSEFWDYVYFGNYIPDLCGIKDNRAKNHVKKEGNRKKYNNELFDFINNNDIDVVFVFSRLTYNNMPSLSKKHIKQENLKNADNGDIRIGRYRDYIKHCKYLANVEHPNVDVLLNRNIDVYGLRHPSAWGGYKIENYSNVLGKLFEVLKN